MTIWCNESPLPKKKLIIVLFSHLCFAIVESNSQVLFKQFKLDTTERMAIKSLWLFMEMKCCFFCFFWNKLSMIKTLAGCGGVTYLADLQYFLNDRDSIGNTGCE